MSTQTTATQAHTITVGRRQITCSCGTTWPAFWTHAEDVMAHVEAGEADARTDAVLTDAAPTN